MCVDDPAETETIEIKICSMLMAALINLMIILSMNGLIIKSMKCQEMVKMHITSSERLLLSVQQS